VILSKRAEVDRFLGHPPPDMRACLIFGKDRGGVRERAEGLAAKIAVRPDDPFDVALLTETDIDNDAARLLDELSAISMMGGRRLVRLKLTGDKAGPDKIAAEALKAHLEGTLNPDAFFLIEAGALERSSPLRKAAEGAKQGAVAIPVYEDEIGDVSRYVREALAADKVGLNAEALEQFVARLPKERGVMRQEIERLILYLGPGSGVTATPTELVNHLGVEPEASLFDAASDAFGGRAKETQSALRRARAEGEGGPAAVRAMGQHLMRLRRAQTLVSTGMGAQEAAKSVGVFWKQEREFLRQLRAWRLPDLDALQPELLEADKACKSTGSPDGLIAERLALSIAGRAKRRGL
jgi:DNA polymerase-3 subunit delta